MNKPLLLKFIAMGGIALLLMVPLTMIGSLIDERGSSAHRPGEWRVHGDASSM